MSQGKDSVAPDNLQTIQQTLHSHFGYSSFRQGQQQVVEAVVAGRSAAAIFATGSGKSLCYQLAALHLPHLTLVVSPLLALMQDQLAFLADHNIPAASIDSSRSGEEVRATMQAARNGTLKILMVSVERLKNERFRQFLAGLSVSLLVIDEAHCISEWGHNFRPDYLKLPDYQHQFSIPQVLLLTATATPAVVEDMAEKFAIARADIISTGCYRPNLDLAVMAVEPQQRDQQLVDWLQPFRYQSTVVYVTLQKTAETLAATLRDHGINAVAYHAGLSSDRRQQIQQGFMDNRQRCIVATIAFGMGIDKSDIRAVVHYDLPKSVENYSQEIGRAGRDGKPSHCLVLGCRDNIHVLENFVYGDTPGFDAIRQLLQQLRAAGSQWELQLNPLSRDCNIRPLPLKTLLVYLEIRGIIKAQYSYFADYRLQYLLPPQQITEHFQGERQAFVRALLARVRLARTWGSLDIDDICRSYPGADRSRVLKALDYFQEQQWIVLESRQMTDVYTVTNNHFVLDTLARELHTLFIQTEQSEIERLQAMVALFESEECLSHQLARWFGDQQAPEHCGHCSACRGVSVAFPRHALTPAPETVDYQAVTAPLLEQLEQADKELISRFLCGIAMPLFTSLKLRSRPGFGLLAQWPFAQVRAWVSRHSQ